ncbi:MAG: DUF364 domain-containing protein [Sterolibacterium sp.]
MRPVADIYLEMVEQISTGLRSPRIKALYLPSGEADAGMDAEFCALELDDGSVGFSFVRMNGTDRLLRAGGVADTCRGMTALELACGYPKDDPVAKALGFAAINALSQSLFTRANWMPPATGDALGQIDPRSGEHIGMIGLFPPLVGRVTAARARLTVLELRSDLAGEHDGFRVTLAPADLAACEKVLSTCTVMLNDTLDAVLDACRDARYFSIIGPTAGCLPDPLFERGVDHIGGRRVVDVDGFREAFCEGRKWGAYTSKYAIVRGEYPGFAELLKQIR